MRSWIWYAVAVFLSLDAIGYTIGAIGPIRRGLAPTDPYWRKRLTLNLMLANHGLYLGAAIAAIGAVFATDQPAAARALFGLTLASCIYTLVTVPLFTPRDTAHVIPKALAAVLIVTGFALGA
jgi:hypothetical protein